MDFRVMNLMRIGLNQMCFSVEALSFALDFSTEPSVDFGTGPTEVFEFLRRAMCPTVKPAGAPVFT
jgi:hypothetical protein